MASRSVQTILMPVHLIAHTDLEPLELSSSLQGLNQPFIGSDLTGSE